MKHLKKFFLIFLFIFISFSIFGNIVIHSTSNNNPGGAPRLLGEWRDAGGAPTEVSGYTGTKGKIRLHYFPPGGVMSAAGWPNEYQTIGFRMKANQYRGWPIVRLTDVRTGRYQDRKVDSYDWKIYYFDVGLADVGIENKNIDNKVEIDFIHFIPYLNSINKNVIGLPIVSENYVSGVNTIKKTKQVQNILDNYDYDNYSNFFL